MSSNLLKMGFANLQDTEKRMIDTNDLVARRIEELAQKMTQPERNGYPGDEELETDVDSFSAGLSAQQVEGLLADDGTEDGIQNNVIKNVPIDREAAKAAEKEAEREQLLAETKGAADAFLADAREKAKQEADRVMEQTREQIAIEREAVYAEAREQGYQEGFQKAEQEFAAKQQALAERERALEAEYEDILKDLEPKLVEAISEAYEFLIGSELSSYRDILLYMISSAVRKIEGGRNFLIHVSEEDYPYVSMEKRQLEAALSSPGAALELVLDTTLGHNECMIETEGGIFDCGLETQMAELKQKLKLLSYEKA